MRNQSLHQFVVGYILVVRMDVDADAVFELPGDHGLVYVVRRHADTGGWTFEMVAIVGCERTKENRELFVEELVE